MSSAATVSPAPSPTPPATSRPRATPPLGLPRSSGTERRYAPLRESNLAGHHTAAGTRLRRDAHRDRPCRVGLCRDVAQPGAADAPRHVLPVVAPVDRAA